MNCLFGFSFNTARKERKVNAPESLQLQDPLGRVLWRGDDHGRGVARGHAREDGGIDDEDVVRAVDLGVEVDHGRAVVDAAVVESQLGSACFTKFH